MRFQRHLPLPLRSILPKLSPMSSDCLFCKIIAGEIPGKFLHQDSEFVVFLDINPKAPVHLLICPTAHYDKYQDSDPEVLARATMLIQDIARKLEIEDNYTIQINNGAKSGQIVFHLHLHLLSSSSTAADRVAELVTKS